MIHEGKSPLSVAIICDGSLARCSIWRNAGKKESDHAMGDTGGRGMSAHILLVDDDAMVTKLLTFLLVDVGYTISTLADPRQVEEFLLGDAVDLILLDVMLPHIDGYALAAETRRAHPDIPIIFLTGRAMVGDKVEGFGNGADDYVAKPFEPTELLARVQAVLRRYRRSERNVHGSIIKVGPTALDIGELRFSAPGRRPALLTPTEMKILECLMRNANVVITREALIERTWGYDCDDFGNRVDVYIRRLRAKIEPEPSDPLFIHTIRGLGYVYRADKRAAA
jgi:two-component system, OmpR family, response regulator RegX3